MARCTSEAAAAMSDEELVDRIRGGDLAHFDLLYDRYFPRVYRFLDRRLPSRADTEEAVQEVFVNLFASLHGFRGEAPFAAWVFGLTRRTLAARFKRKRPKTVPLVTEDDEQATRMPAAVAASPDPHEAYEFQERLGRMTRAVSEDLSEEQWTLFRLHHLENRSIQDIARSFAKTEDAVKSHLYRARKLLLAR